MKPAHRKARELAGLASWAVNVPAELSPTTKRQELFFQTRLEAKAACERLKARKDNFGISMNAMTPARISLAAEAYRLLDPHDIDLLDAVRSHLRVAVQRATSVTLGTAFDKFAELAKTKSIKYQQEIRQARATFAPLLDRLVCDISVDDLEPILVGLPNSARNAKMRRLRSVFNLSAKRGWMAPGTSPVARMNFSDSVRGEVEIIPVDLVVGMLEHAIENDPELAVFLTLAFFTGIRPAEIAKLEWGDIDLIDGTITIRPEVSKTNRRRFPELSENAIAWIEAYRQRGGSMEGRVVQSSPAVFRKKRRANWKAVAGGNARWIQQGARHTFCSCWLALHGDAGKLVLLSGHTDAQTMWDHYHKGVKKVEAQRFWSITPSADLANVVAFQKQA